AGAVAGRRHLVQVSAVDAPDDGVGGQLWREMESAMRLAGEQFVQGLEFLANRRELVLRGAREFGTRRRLCGLGAAVMCRRIRSRRMGGGVIVAQAIESGLA